VVQFTILLPLYFNDGTPVPVELITRTEDELLDFFGAMSTDTARVHGRWTSQGRLFSDTLLRVTVACDGTAEQRAFVRNLKEALKTRFQQEEIWITVQQIEII
jgi:hypothetical protein